MCVAGVLGLVGACTLGGLRFNKRPVGVPASFYLMQLRVAAQGCVVGSLAVGLAFSLYQQGGHWPKAETQARSELSDEKKSFLTSYHLWH